MPHCVAEQDTFQVTPPLLVSLLTVPASRAVDPAGTVAALGETDTAMARRSGEEVEEPPPHPNVATTTTIATAASKSAAVFLATIKFGSHHRAVTAVQEFGIPNPFPAFEKIILHLASF